MNPTKTLRDLELFFSSYPELKTAAPQFFRNKITPKSLKDSVKSIKDLDSLIASVRLTPTQKSQLRALLFPVNTTTARQSLDTRQAERNSVQDTKRLSVDVVLKPEVGEDEFDDSKEKMPGITINTSRARSELKLLKAIIEKNKMFGWKEAIGTKGDVMWLGLDIPWEDTYIAKEIRINRIPGMKNLSHKKMTGFYLNKFREYYPDEFDFYPRTFLIPEELDSFKKYMEEHPDKLFIAKPTAGGHGDGIVLVKKFSDLPLSSFVSNEMVVQEYLDRPLLHDGKKFDLRIYVLVSNVKPMLAFLNEEGLARFCTEDYEPPTKENLKNSYMHLTNYSLNKLSDNYKYTEECEEINDGSKRTLMSLWKGLERQGVSKEEIMGKVRRLLKRLLVSLQPIMEFNYNSAFEGKDNGRCFHVLGVDILVDQDLKPWLLEINANPSLNIAHEDYIDSEAKEIISPIDKYVKEKVLEDALLIVRKSVGMQGNMSKYRSYELVYDSEKGDFKQMDLFKDILEIFGKLSGTKFKTHMASPKFRRLAGIAGMTNKKLVKAHYDIIYQRLVKRSEDKQMNFSAFIQAIEEITSILKKGEYDPENKRELIEQVVQTIKLGLV